MSKGKRQIHVSPYERKKNGKIEKVGYKTNGFTRNIAISQSYLNFIDLEKAKAFNVERFLKTHPDALKNSRLTFLVPNEYWQKNPNKCDVIGFDAKDSPIVKELPKLGIPNQIVKYNGKDYIADKNGEFKPIGVKERKTKSKKPKSEPKPKPSLQGKEIEKKIEKTKEEIVSMKKSLENPKISDKAKESLKIALRNKKDDLLELVHDDHPKIKSLSREIKKLEDKEEILQKQLYNAYNQKGYSQEEKDKLLAERQKISKLLEAKEGIKKKLVLKLMDTKTIKKPKEFYDHIKFEHARTYAIQLKAEIQAKERELEKAKKNGESKGRLMYLESELGDKHVALKKAIEVRNRIDKLPRKSPDIDDFYKKYGKSLKQINLAIEKGEKISKAIYNDLNYNYKEKYNDRQEEIKKIQDKFKEGEDITNDELQRLPFIQQRPILDLQWERRRARLKAKENRESSKFRNAKNKLKRAKDKFFDKYDVSDDDEHLIQEIDGMPVIMDHSRISMLTTPEWINHTDVGKSALVDKTNIKAIDKFAIGVSGHRFLITKNKFGMYDVDRIEKITKKMDKDSLEMYYGTGQGNVSPLIIKDKNFAYALAPRCSEDDETGEPSEWDDELEITKEEYKKWNKYTTEEMLQLSEPTIKEEKQIGKRQKGNSLYMILSNKNNKEFQHALKKRKEDMKLKGKIKGFWYRDTNNFGENSLMRGDRIATITSNEEFNRSKFHTFMKDNYKEIDFNDSYLKDDGSNGIIVITPDKKSGYKFDLTSDAIKDSKNDVKILYKQDHPLVIRGSEKTIAIAPRVLMEDETSFEPDIPMSDFNRLNKLNKKELAKKCGFEDNAKVSGKKESWIFDAYKKEKGIDI